MRGFFWFAFSRIRTHYIEILRICPYSVQMRENTDKKKLRIWTLLRHWVFLRGVESRLLLKKTSFRDILVIITYIKYKILKGIMIKYRPSDICSVFFIGLCRVFITQNNHCVSLLHLNTFEYIRI